MRRVWSLSNSDLTTTTGQRSAAWIAHRNQLRGRSKQLAQRLESLSNRIADLLGE